MPSAFNMTAHTSAEPSHSSAPIDWSAKKAAIVASLDVQAEYEALGVVFTGKTWADKLECHAFGREDAVASAFVSLRSGVYCDSGSGEKGMNLIDFAAKHGSLGPWKDCLKHYASKAGVEIGTIKAKSGGRVLETTFDYHDRNGQAVYRVFRYILPNGEKAFTQHPLRPNGDVVFETGAMSRVAPVPFRLTYFPDPEAGQWLFVCEGEKAALALVSLGFNATTAHGGTGSTAKLWPVVSAYFEGQHVVVLPDNDATGQKAAATIAATLDGKAASIRVLDLPGLPRKGDAVEWIEAGGTRAELEQLAEACPPWEPGRVEAESVEDDLEADATAEDLVRVMSAEAWLWKGWIPSGALTLLAAQAGKGKTRFLMDLHRRLYNGHPWPDSTWPVNPIDQPKVLWVAGDRQFKELRDIPPAFGIPRDRIILNTKRKDPFGGRMLESADQWEDLEERILRHSPAFVAIDTITKTGHFKSQDTVDAMKQYGPLADIAARTGVPIICVTHLSKSGNALGVRAVESVRTVIQLSHPNPNDASEKNRRRLWVEKSFDEIPDPLGITLSGTGNEYDTNPPEPQEDDAQMFKKSKPKVTPPAVIEAATWLTTIWGGKTVRVKIVRDAADEKGIGVSVLYKARDHLGIVQIDDDPSGYKLWPIPEAA